MTMSEYERGSQFLSRLELGGRMALLESRSCIGR
jgi:hypothetical protein